MLRNVSLGAAVLFCLLAVAVAQQSPTPSSAIDQISGMYSFLRDGEFVHLTDEDGQLSGLISRFGESSSDKGQFIDQFFDTASLNGDHVKFKTKTVHGVWYAFDGTVSTTPGKTPMQEGYRVLKGTLTLHEADAKGDDKASERKVEFKSFPK